MESDRFDHLVKVLAPNATRRASLGLFATGLFRLLWHGEDAAAKDKKRKGKKRKTGKKNRRHPEPKPKPTCSAGACAAEPTWLGDDGEIGFCEDKCQRCKKAGTPFCIHDPDDEHLAIHATCCHKNETCCGRECCGPPESKTCCSAPDGQHVCIHGVVECCVDDSTLGYCFPGEECCPGTGCVPKGECGTPCVLEARGSRAECPPSDGCGGRCAAQGLQCCGDFCYDPAQAECCAPPAFGLCPKSIQHCCTTVDGSINYCQANGEPC